jgi:hypothetical protein
METMYEEMDRATWKAQCARDDAAYERGEITLWEYLARFRAMQKPHTSNAVDLIREDRDDPNR